MGLIGGILRAFAKVNVGQMMRIETLSLDYQHFLINLCDPAASHGSDDNLFAEYIGRRGT